MLIKLKLKNIALIEIIEINFEKGLNIITGDSGSGKSLILDSLNVLFGGNNIPLNHLIRPGKENCSIEAQFLSSPKVEDWLIQNGFHDISSKILVTRKSYKKNNKILSKFLINDLFINKKLLGELGLLLIDFAGQSDSFLFDSQDYRKQIIDDLGTEKLEAINLEVKNNWDELQILKQKLEDLMESDKKENENNFALKEMFKILEEANLNSSDEIKQLKLKESRLANNFDLRSSAQETLNNLINYRTDDLSVGSLIIKSIKNLNKIVAFDHEIQPFIDKLINIQNDVENLIFDLRAFLEQIESDEISLEDIQSRLFYLRNLERTFSLDLPQLIHKKNQLKIHIDSPSNKEIINKLENQIHELTCYLNDLFNIQSAERREIANQLENSVICLLNKLSLENAHFSIEFKRINPTSSGIDNINFLFSANPDQNLAPLSQVISGGEMSRFLFAIKSSISKNSNIFFLDEIDSGLSGKSLFSLVEVIKAISLERQVLCITHQPFLAAAANAHFKVKKNVINGLTFTSIGRLSTKKERQNELIELIGGCFNEANDYASKLIARAAA